MKPQKMKKYASFNEWKSDQSAKNQRLISALAGLVKKTAPEFTPTVKWGQGCWTLGDTPKVYIHAEPGHVQCGFFAGSTLEDPEGLLVGSGKHVRHVKVLTTQGIPRAALVALLKQVLSPVSRTGAVQRHLVRGPDELHVGESSVGQRS